MPKIEGLEGSYYKRSNGSYQVRYNIRWDKNTNRYKYFSKTVYSMNEVYKLLDKINNFIKSGNPPRLLNDYIEGINDYLVSADDTDFRTLANQFLESQTIKAEVSDRTLSDYSCHINKMLPYLGHISINNITPAVLDQMFLSLRSNDSRNTDNKSVSGTYAAHIYSTLKLILDRAVRYDLISKNPCERIDKPKRDTQEKICLNIQQARCLVSKASSDPLDPKMIGLLICLLSGTRLSEMLALTWEDYHDKTLFINKSMKKDSQEFKSTKTGHNRQVPIPSTLCDVLDRWHQSQKDYFKHIGLPHSEKIAIVNSQNGLHMTASNYGRWFRNSKEKFELPDDFTIHGLRHTYVTLTQTEAEGDIATVSRMAGHASIDMTNHYTHANVAAMQKIADNFNQLITTSNEKTCKTCIYWSDSPSSTLRGSCWLHHDENMLSIKESNDSCCSWKG